jgi:hypothetical protein
VGERERQGLVEEQERECEEQAVAGGTGEAPIGRHTLNGNPEQVKREK